MDILTLIAQATNTAPGWTMPALIFGGMYVGAEIAKKAIDAVTHSHRKNSNGSALSKEEFSMLSANRSNIKGIRETMTEMLGILKEIRTELQHRPRSPN